MTLDMLPTILMLVGLLAFAVSVVVEVTKNLGFMKKIPTDLIVILLSMIFTVGLFFAYMCYANVAFEWYMLFGAIVASFFVAFICMYGWEKITGLYTRFKK